MRRLPAPASRGLLLALLLSLALHALLLWLLNGPSSRPATGVARFEVGLLAEGGAARGATAPAASPATAAAAPARTARATSKPVPPMPAVARPPAVLTAPSSPVTLPERGAVATKPAPAIVQPAGPATGSGTAAGAAADSGTGAGTASTRGEAGGPASANYTPAQVRPGYLDSPPPDYPARSRELGEQGRVELRVRVGRDGRPLEVQIARSSGFARLDRAAQRAAEQWRFSPARQGDTPVESWLTVPMPFRLN